MPLGSTTSPTRTDGSPRALAAAMLDALSRLRLSVKTPWPLALVVPESCADRYNACATFLLQLRRARASVEEASRSGWTPAARRASGSVSGGPHARALLRLVVLARTAARPLTPLAS